MGPRRRSAPSRRRRARERCWGSVSALLGPGAGEGQPTLCGGQNQLIPTIFWCPALQACDCAGAMTTRGIHGPVGPARLLLSTSIVTAFGSSTRAVATALELHQHTLHWCESLLSFTALRNWGSNHCEQTCHCIAASKLIATRQHAAADCYATARRSHINCSTAK